MQKELQLITPRGRHHRLTVTPDRITIKIVEGTPKDDVMMIQDFFLTIANSDELKDVTQTWRGKLEEKERAYPNGNVAMGTVNNNHYEYFKIPDILKTNQT